MQTIFPAQYSTLSAIALQEYLIDAYQLHQSSSCKLLIRNVSDTYIIENKDIKYIFKIYRDAHRKLSEIEAEIELLNLLKADNHSISYPLSDKDGNQIQYFNAVEGIRHGVLFSFAEGLVIHDLTKTNLISLGRDIAKLHQTTSRIRLKNDRAKLNFETILIEPLKTLKIQLADMPDELNYLEKISAKVIKKFETFNTNSFGYGYCHYDFFPKNFHFNDDGKITFFDFDFAAEGFLINDLMSLLNHFFFHQLNKRITKKQAELDFETFLSAYQEIRNLTADEKLAIPYLGITFHIFFLKFFYDNYDDWSNTFLTPAYVKHRIDLIKKWEELYCNF